MSTQAPSQYNVASHNKKAIRGSLVAMVTPMQRDGEIDWSAFRALIDWHTDEGTDALVIMGTTGETATVTWQEHRELIRVAVEHAGGRIPIVAGTGANSTREAVELGLYAKEVGADAHLSVTPYYNKPVQEGIFQHFRCIAQDVDLPMIVYNVPGRTVVDIADDTVFRLAELPNVVGLKDATGDIGRGVMLMRQLPGSCQVFSGDDETAAALMLLGASGNISVTANVVPALMKALCRAAMQGDVPAVRKISRQLAPLNRLLFVQSNPIPVKWLLAQMGKIDDHVRLPLTGLASEYYAKVFDAFRLAQER